MSASLEVAIMETAAPSAYAVGEVQSTDEPVEAVQYGESTIRSKVNVYNDGTAWVDGAPARYEKEYAAREGKVVRDLGCLELPVVRLARLRVALDA